MIDKTLPNITPGIITGINLMLSTAMAWETCFKFDLGLQWSLIFVPTYYFIVRKQQEAVNEALKNIEPEIIIKEPDSEDSIKFHEQCVAETNIIREQLAREEDEKLEKILSYTKETFMRMKFSQSEVSQILDCVRYFVRHKDVLKANALKISKKPEVTQASLKNFAWNIAFQYGIDGETTAIFVKATFGEWFSNTEISSIQKTLRNIRGSHAIEIDERILNG